MTDIKSAIQRSLDINAVVDVDLLHDDIEAELAGLDVWSDAGWHIIVTFIGEYL